ncbi:unnamed protein product [[Candida] boidinii]|uniref:Unnamed protein product n=1 Tax=Candida boidinii TaxID=5477 RepID=A0A9W6STI7_CANBO|nr:hypothetical protein B5S30_g708 [[Candida] boidinii]GME66642.1 unnamed protein product [[Candida] boidinii]
MNLSSLLGSSNSASAVSAASTASTASTSTTTATKSKPRKTTTKTNTAKKPKTSRNSKSNTSSVSTSTTNTAPIYVKQPVNNENVYDIPISLTKYQRELIEILLQLHRPSLFKYIDNILNNNTNGTTKSEFSNDSSVSSENLSDESLRELLLSNIYQITTHSSLLVNHYMPNKMLLMDTKETLNNGSSKFGKLNEIINGLIRMTDFTDIEGKNIIITASTSKELDLIESTLLGKELQYYRFSGSSIYYQNHGTFNYVNNGLKQNENTVNASGDKINNEIEENEDTSSNKKSDTSNGKNPKNNISAATSTSTGTAKKTKGRKPKKAAANEKKGQETAEEPPTASSNTTNGSHESSNNSSTSHGRSKRTGKSTKTDEYISRISKNSEVYEKLKQKEGKNKLNIYLILSGQLKNLIINNFNGPKENLNNRSIKLRNDKIDFIISLDPFVNQIQNVSYSIPIIRLIPINSIEHISILFNNKNFKSLNEERQNLVYDTILNRNRNDSSEVISDSQLQLLLNWLLNPVPKEFPKEIKLGEDIIDYTNINHSNKFARYNELKESLKDLNFTQLYELKNYKFFQEELNNDAKDSENGNTIKKIKIDNQDSENNSENLINSKWINMTYSEYESNLSELITRHYRQTVNSIKTGKKYIELVRNDESKRQDNFETKNEQIGKFFKSNQEIKTTVDNLNRNLSKNIDEISKYEKNKEKLSNRFNRFNNKISNNDSNSISEIEITEQEKIILDLRDKLKIQQDSNESVNGKNEELRVIYQESSASAAELSNELKALKSSNEEINKKLKGPSKELYNEYLNNSIKFNELEKLKIDKQVEFLKNYCSKLNLIVKERNLLLSNVVNSRSTRHSRSSTPY